MGPDKIAQASRCRQEQKQERSEGRGMVGSGSHPIKLFIEIHILEFIKSIRAETLLWIGIIMKDESSFRAYQQLTFQTIQTFTKSQLFASISL